MLLETKTKFPHTRITTNLNCLIKQLLQEIGPGYEISSSAYDTAWLARLVKLDEPIGYEALAWLRANQLEDGSWGASEPLYYHDRVICTLSAIITLEKYGDDSDAARIDRALPVFYEYLGKLNMDPAGETIAFEMLLPALMAEGKTIGLLPSGGTSQLNELALARETKLAKAPGRMISRQVTMAFSTEMVGPNGLHLVDVANLQEANGSVAYSPAATVFYSLYARPQDRRALAFLRSAAVNGSVPYIAPIEVFERGWALWNLALPGVLNDELLQLCQPHLDAMIAEWQPGIGIAACEGLTLVEADTTSLVYDTLLRYGRTADLDAILRYEEDDHFRCFGLEANPSLSTNIHVLSALRQTNLGVQHPSVQKVLRFLSQTQINNSYWIDKWHASPFYPTAHAIIAAAGYDNKLVENAVNWILEQQNADGSWGFYEISTAEETAYCLQALSVWRQNYGTIPFGVIERGIYWLVNHMDRPYPPLWIGKSLYSPILVVRSAILGALAAASQITIMSGKNGVDFCDN